MVEEFIKPVRTIGQDDLDFPDYSLSKTPRELPREDEATTDNTNRHFKGQQQNETVLCFTRKHWVVLVPHFIGFAAFLLAVPAFIVLVPAGAIESFIGQVAYRALAGVAIAVATFYIHRFFLRLLNYYLQITIITNFRVLQLDQTLYLSRNRDSIDLPEIQDILIQQKGIVKSIFNYGELVITLSSAHASKTLTCMPNPEYYFRKINTTKREYISNRRMHKSDSSSS